MEGANLGTPRLLAYAPGDGSGAGVVSDFDRDGRADIATATGASADGLEAVHVMLGEPGGIASPPAPYAAKAGEIPAMATADFNADGYDDLVVTYHGADYLCPMGPCHGFGFPIGGFAVLMNHGDGTFESPRMFPSWYGPRKIWVANFRLPGVADILIYEEGSNTQPPEQPRTELFLNDGFGSFTSSQLPIATPTLATADFNRDGALDIASADGCSVTVLLGDGHGSFTTVDTEVVPAASADAGQGTCAVTAMAAGDLDGDGRPDLAVLSAASANPSSPGNAVLNIFLNVESR
jgi:hypothetical protein